MMGAAFAAAAPGIPSWNAGYDGGNDLGGLLSAVLSPAGGFSKFLLVLIAFGTSCAAAPTMYTFGKHYICPSSNTQASSGSTRDIAPILVDALFYWIIF